MGTHYRFTEARQNMSRILNDVEAGGIAIIERRGTQVMVTRVDESAEDLRECYAFNPQVFPEGDQVEIWLPELAIFGVGSSLEEAESDLVAAALSYADDWGDHLRAAPNHAPRRGWVRRIQLAASQEELRRLLFDE